VANCDVKASGGLRGTAYGTCQSNLARRRQLCPWMENAIVASLSCRRLAYGSFGVDAVIGLYGSRRARVASGFFSFLVAITCGATRTHAVPVERIVSLAPSVTEILFALGVGDRVVGVSTYCDYPPKAAKIDRIGTFLSPNVELILSKRPDLVIGVPSPGNRKPVEMLEDLGLRIVIVEPERVGAILSAIRTIAAAVGVEKAGEELVDSIERQMKSITARLAGAPRPKVLMVVGRRPLVAVGKGSYQDELIELAHGTNVAAQTGERWPNLGFEFVLEQAPDVIIDAGMGSEAMDRESGIAFWRAFPSLPAVRENRIYGYQAFELLRPGPRVAETLEMVARYIHPERFGEISGGDGETPSPAAQGGVD
jgi:iron complex transport system substrate-binding protein